MALNLESVHAKLKRAEAHAQALTDEIMPWLQLNTYVLRKSINADSTRYAITVHLVGSEPPVEKWSLIIGDCLHNLRCALDHLVYAIAVHKSGIDPPLDATSLMFVIADNPVEFTKSSKRIQSLSALVRAAIEGVQPFNRTHTSLPPLLAVLANLENIDKHRLVSLARPSIGQGKIGLSGHQDDMNNLPEFTFFNGEAIADNSEIFAATFKSPAPGLTFHEIDVDNLIALFHKKKNVTDPDSAGRSECMTLMKQLIDEVRAVIELVVAAVR